MSASFDFYKTVYMGKIDNEDDFLLYRKRATEYISNITAGKADPYLFSDCECEQPEVELDTRIQRKVDYAVCAVADQYVAVDIGRASVMKGYTESDGFIASETVGSHSRTFRSGYDVAKEAENALYSVAANYLAWTGLLYRGIPCTRHT